MNSANHASSVDFKNNSLNTLKILAALQVAYLHAVTHLGIQINDTVTAICNLFMGVPIFFVLSGFLIWNSINRSKDFKDYAKKRAQRIFPELWLGVAVEIVVLIIFLKDKIKWLDLIAFAAGQGTFLQFWTPNSLRDFGCGTPNGALWTLGITIQFYIIVWFLYKFLKNKNIYYWCSALLISIVIKALSPTLTNVLPGIIGKLYGKTILPYLWMFLLGAFLAHYRDISIPFLKKTWWIFIPISIVLDHFKLDIGHSSYGVFIYILRVSGFIGLCYLLPKINISFDFSYGMFIYHMIVINVMIELGFVGKVYHLFIALAISIVLSILSALFGKYIVKALSKKTEVKNANKA